MIELNLLFVLFQRKNHPILAYQGTPFDMWRYTFERNQ